MNLIIKNTIIFIFLSLTFSAVISAQSRVSSSVNIKIKIVKNISVNLQQTSDRSSLIYSRSNSKNQTNLSDREVIVFYNSRIQNSSNLPNTSFLAQNNAILILDNEIKDKFTRVASGEYLDIKDVSSAQKLNIIYENKLKNNLYPSNPTVTIVY
ncbi:MAG: hypothetical protein H6610_11625 [Ignavibacteriales bacterium]|nr:hypothetical protein [Ignavibacteriota bacterium]MCB9211800.1 hypothetical protein [Ignavibacteriales bacterium]MCB9220093.1 hypothetical protein [Ignavibacteriales bacterium]